ncbi:DUF6479 family protein [Kitasatospora sp. NPDC059463]
MPGSVVQIAAPLAGGALVIPAVLIVAVLIGAFVWGSRRQARRRKPAYPPRYGPGPRPATRNTSDEHDADDHGPSGHGG